MVLTPVVHHTLAMCLPNEANEEYVPRHNCLRLVNMAVGLSNVCVYPCLVALWFSTDRFEEELRAPGASLSEFDLSLR